MSKRNKCRSNKQLNGQVVIITGANHGIGKETAYQLSLRGAKIIIGCRDELRAENAIKEIVSLNPNANIIHIKLDLSSLQSIRAFVQQIYENETKIDLLINNAGIGADTEGQTEDGFELSFGTNHLGHYLLTLQLLPLLRKAPKARIINVSSSVYASGKINFENINLRNGAFEMWTAYSQSKLANVLFTRELAKRLGDNTTISAYSLHPGIINTEWYRHIESPVGKFIAKNFTKMFAISIERGTQTTLYCALEESLDNESGFYYENKYEGDTRLDGQVVVITGANQGIGKETAYQLSLRGAKTNIIIGCRDELRAENAIKEIVSRNPNANIIHIKLDLSSLQSIRAFVQQIYENETKIDLLINNAAIASDIEGKTEDGFELIFGTSHLGHYLLTLQLLPLLRKAPKARVINVSSLAYASGRIHFENINLRNGAFNMMAANSQSKLATVLFTRELAKRLGANTTINAYSLHPGLVDTEWYRHIESPVVKFIAKNVTKMFAMSVERGTQTTLYCALEESLDSESGFYYEFSIRAFVQQIYENETKIDLLINNAGIGFIPELKTDDGFEMTFGTNHLGHYLLTLQLLPLLRNAPKARVITLSSGIHMLGKIHFDNLNLRNGVYDHQEAYAQSKLANVLFTRELAKRLGANTSINAYSLHPGVVATDWF
ncbi:unnamed protein product [Oppiella nova]|uniref:Short-chain dehydrogenase n=1 Tax=Oppiella nova TaxID=334625 RepID=A0A7R9M0X0_9ACAR|nr:unnamed protein product [Oppiella nova]CAG2168275.1 unnamed protein product [Oppiella nova]